MLRSARYHRPVHSHQRRMLPPDQAHFAGGLGREPEEPAPVNARTATIKRVTGAILAAFAEALPDRVPADSGGEMLFWHSVGCAPMDRATSRGNCWHRAVGPVPQRMASM